MPPIERDIALPDKGPRHQHSASDYGRALIPIPMWDSSDPVRAPPPLPLNPQSPSVGVGTSRAGTSAAIQSAHAALNEKARESALGSTALARRIESPERTPRAPSAPSTAIPSSQPHRRIQPVQPGSVRDLSLMIEGGRDSNSPTQRSPEKSARPSTPVRSREPLLPNEMIDDRNDRPMYVSPVPGPSYTPIVRPIVRRPHQTILGENTSPQSATMLALHSMANPNQKESVPLPAFPPAAPQRESPALSNVTNGAAGGLNLKNGTPIAKQSLPGLDALSHQILSLTNIATSLQKEMFLLSRRSRDNATDLLSLKAATNARDEDIRKSLRELITSSSDTKSQHSRDPFSGGFLIDSKPHAHMMSPKSLRPFSLPRIPSPNSFAASIDRDSMSTPSLYGADGQATITLVEKVLHEMGTKEGQELLHSRLSEIMTRLEGMASASKIEELLRLVKERQEQTVISMTRGSDAGDSRSRTSSFDDPCGSEMDYASSDHVTDRMERLMHRNVPQQRRSSAPAARADFINDDVLKVIKTVKDSVAQGGGLTAEVKALVRELRGEVLGMGREIGRRLDEVWAKDEGSPDSAMRADMAKVIEEGLAEMKQHMGNLMREHRRQSAGTVATAAAAAAEAIPPIDYEEVHNLIRAALKESQASQLDAAHATKEDVIEAVKDAWESYKPDIEVQQIGLERDEVLVCLQEGLRQYAPRDERPAGATPDEVFAAVAEGLKHFVPPQMPAASLSRDEILGAVRECLEEFEFPIAPSAMGAEITKEDMVDAVKEGLNGFDFPQADRGSMALVVPSTGNDEIVGRLQEIMKFMRDEFRAVSEEAKENVAASGRDTEQVLDATRDGLEKLRADLEVYVDKVSSAVTGQDFSEELTRTLDVFRDEIGELVSKANDGSKVMLRDEIESLRDTVNSSLVPAIPQPQPPSATMSNREVLEALQEGVGLLRNEINNRHVAGTSEVLDALQEGMADLRDSIEKFRNKPNDLTANDEILDALKSGLSDVRTDIDGLRDQSRALATVDNTALVPAEIVRPDDIKNLEMLIKQLHSKAEAVDPAQPVARDMPSEPVPEAAAASPLDDEWKEKLASMESKLHMIHESLSGLTGREAVPLPVEVPRSATDAANREDVEAIETILRNTKARLDDMIDDNQVVRKDHIDAIEALVLDTKLSLSGLKTQMDELSSREDVNMVESLVGQVAKSFDEMKQRHEQQLDDPERVTKTDINAITMACLDVKSAVANFAKVDEITELPTKQDLARLEAVVGELKSRLETEGEVSAKAFEERQAEIVGVSERVSEVKVFLEQFQETVQANLQGGVVGMESVGKILDTLGDTVGRNSNDLHELLEKMRAEFEESRAGVVGAKLETDERFQKTTDTLQAKIDERIGELLAKLDELQAASDDRAKAGEARDAEVESAVVGTKVLADELKLLVDTLGSAVTDSLEKMEEASKTVFDRVGVMVDEAEEHHVDAKVEHQQTRDQVKEAIDVVNGLQGHVAEYQPKILDTIKDVLLVVSEHYEHSKASSANMQEKLVESRGALEQQLLPPPVQKYDDSTMQEKLDKLVGQTDRAADAFTKLDKMDELVSHTHAVDQALAKLDRLVEHSEDTDKTLVQLEKLDTLEYLVAQSESTTQALTDLEKLVKLDQIIDLTNLAGRAFDSQRSKIERLVEHMHTTNESLKGLEKLDELSKLGSLDQLEKLSQLERLQQLEQLAQLANLQGLQNLEQLTKMEKLDRLEQLDKLEGLEKLDQLFDLDQLQKLQELEKLQELQKLQELEKLQQLDKLQEMEKLQQLEKLEELEKLRGLEKLQQLEKLEELEKLQQLDALEQLGKLGQLEKLEELEKLEQLQKLEQLEKLEQLAKLEQLEKLGQLDNLGELGKLQQLDKLDQLEKLGQLDSLGQLEKLEQMEKLEQLSKLDQLERMGQLDKLAELEKLGQLERLEKMDQLEKLDQLDQLDQLGQLEKLNQLDRLEKLDKLDKLDQFDELVDNSRSADRALSRLDILELVHDQMRRTAAEISVFVSTHTQRVTEEHESREKALHETAVALERRQVEMEQAEASITSLQEEERRLKESVMSLRAEQESLLRSRTRMTADVSSLEMALHIRREELHEMEARAEGLERRILDGVMDHSRILLMAKANKGREAMSRKRVVPKGAEEADSSSKPRSAFSIAMAKRNSLAASSLGGTGKGGSRRILSLSQMNKNSPSGGMKRSQSVRTVGEGLRKSSWGGGQQATKGPGGGLETDKENTPLQETDEEEGTDDERMSDDSMEDYETQRPEDDARTREVYGTGGGSDGEKHSEAGTLRKSSYGTSVGTGLVGSEADEDFSDADDDVMSEWASSQADTNPAAPGSVEGNEGHSEMAHETEEQVV